MSAPGHEPLQWISDLLLWPDLVLLYGLLAITVVRLGDFAAEGLSRCRRQAAWRQFLRRLKAGDVGEAPDQLPGASPRAAAAYAEWRACPAHGGKILDDLQLDIEAELKKLHIAIRLGPMLGLIGTLIPLGPALKGLAAGDVQTLTANLITAFACPVIGITAGGLSFFIHSVRQAWRSQELSDLDFIFATFAKEKS